jgi:hypothetical protein
MAARLQTLMTPRGALGARARNTAAKPFAVSIWIVDAHRDDGRRFIVHADEKLTAFVELERQVLTVTFYFESIQ